MRGGNNNSSNSNSNNESGIEDDTTLQSYLDSPYLDRKRLLEEYNNEIQMLQEASSSEWPLGPDTDTDAARRCQTTATNNNNNKSSKVMKAIGNTLAILTTLLFLISLPTLAYLASKYDKTRPDAAAILSASIFVLTTVTISLRQIHNHLTNWYMPDVQKYVVRLLFMVPIYAVQSFLSLSFHTARIYIDTLRDLYEAFVISSFLYYLIELLGGQDHLVNSILEGKDVHYGRHSGGMQYFFGSHWTMGLEFMLQCKHGVLQYVVVKTLATVATAGLEPFGWYQEGIFGWNGYTYISFCINVSQMWALYCLIKFYHATSEDLRNAGGGGNGSGGEGKDWHPLGKFLCVKGVVFFTWWQGVGIALLQSRGVIDTIGTWDADDVANGLQDYLVCVEMFCFAIAHAFTFTHKEYIPRNSSSGGGGGGDVNEDLGSNGGANNGIANDDRYTRHLLTEEEEEDDDYYYDDDGYRPPTIRTLDAPMRVRDALWSSTSVGEETMKEIKRFRHGVEDQIRDQSSDLEGGTIHMASMQYAESI